MLLLLLLLGSICGGKLLVCSSSQPEAYIPVPGSGLLYLSPQVLLLPAQWLNYLKTVPASQLPQARLCGSCSVCGLLWAIPSDGRLLLATGISPICPPAGSTWSAAVQTVSLQARLMPRLLGPKCLGSL